MKSLRQRISLFSGMLLLLAASTILFSSYKMKKSADDIWQLLGISRQTGTESIRNSFFSGYLEFYSVKNLRKIAVNDRAAIAKDLLTYTKEYVSGAEFKKKYNEMRTSSMPIKPERKPLRTVAQIQKEEIAKTEKSIKDTEKTIKELGGDFAKNMEPVLKMLKTNLKDYQNPENEYFKNIALGEKYDQENEMKSYEERMERWKKEYPENSGVYVAKRLTAMLKETEGIDYNAELVEKYGKKRFVNKTFESKSSAWKQGFRAGKDVTEPARDFVKKWLTEIAGK